MGSLDIWWEGGCWEWDVAAGIAILEEAGGLVTTANPPEDNAEIPEAHLGGRLYLAIRYVPIPSACLANPSGLLATQRPNPVVNLRREPSGKCGSASGNLTTRDPALIPDYMPFQW